MKLFGKEKRQKGPEEQLIERIDRGEFKAGLVEEVPSGLGYRYGKYVFCVPTPAEKLESATREATAALVALPEAVRGQLSLRMVFNDNTERIYGKGVAVVIVEETEYHSTFQDTSGLKENLRDIGNRLMLANAPAEVRKALTLMAMKRGTDDAVDTHCAVRC